MYHAPTNFLFLSVAFAGHHVLSNYYPNAQSGVFDSLIQKQTAGLSADQLTAAQNLAVPIASAVVKSRYALSPYLYPGLQH